MEMEAGDWKELDFLLKSAGVPIDEAMGLDSDDDESGSPKSSPNQELFIVISALWFRVQARSAV